MIKDDILRENKIATPWRLTGFTICILTRDEDGAEFEDILIKFSKSSVWYLPSLQSYVSVDIGQC